MENQQNQQEMSKIYEQFSSITMKNRIGNLMEEILNLETALRIANAEIEKQKGENQKLAEELNQTKEKKKE